ncbi:unnamed protein product, partial [Rangifer tarandus platyrhynchus]
PLKSRTGPVLGEMLSFQPTEGRAGHRAREAEVFGNEAPSGPRAAPSGRSGRVPSLPSALPFPSRVPVGRGDAEPAPCSSRVTGLRFSALP